MSTLSPLSERVSTLHASQKIWSLQTTVFMYQCISDPPMESQFRMGSQQHFWHWGWSFQNRYLAWKACLTFHDTKSTVFEEYH